MWVADEVQLFAKQHHLSDVLTAELSGLCTRLIERALATGPHQTENIQTTYMDDLPQTHTLTASPENDALIENLLHRDTPILDADAAAPLAFDASEGPLDLSARYQDKGILGVGGMGEVRRVIDRHIGRRLAMKILKPNLLTKPQSVARFIEEAQVVGQLQHPGLVPVYDIGCLSDGRPYFTMREIRGRELGEVISEVHAASEGGDWQTEPSGWTFRRIVRAFAWVCETVGYAHSKGVIHRDLKPSNILIGTNDEVLVVDWGIAKVIGQPDALEHNPPTNPEIDTDAVITARSQDLSLATLTGAITGTPAYMSPEQAFGQISEIDARSDVYALGAVLYQILCGRAPYRGPNAVTVLVAVGHGPPKPVVQASPRALPPELVEVCERAMSRDRPKRFESAKDMALALNDWLDSTKRHDKALQWVESAIALEQSAAGLRATAQTLRLEGELLLEGIPSYASEEQKHPGWAKEDEAQNLLRQADLQDIEADQQLHAALTYVPDLAKAHAQLARRYLSDHRHAEAAQQPDITMRAEVRLRAHAEILPTQSPDRLRFFNYLQGLGSLTLHTDPPGAEVHLYRYVEHRRRLHEVFERVLGRTPLQGVPLEAGSYLCVIQHPDCEPVRYPVMIERQAHWDGVPPDESAPLPIPLPKLGSLRASEVYVPAGYYWAGGDNEAPGAITRRRLWVEGFVISRFPITNRDYIGFLDALVAAGREEDALRFVPRERAGTVDELGASIYGRDERGGFVLRADADGDMWLAEWPVLMVDWFCAAAYCAHLCEQTGQRWRLPNEWCREKAARGVDGRFFPWGNRFDASWCCMRDSHEGPPKPALVDSFPLDVSPYGVRGMAGNSRDWCDSLWTKDGPSSSHVALQDAPAPNKDANVVFRGGSWIYLARGARVANRNRVRPGLRDFDVGFRVARPLRP